VEQYEQRSGNGGPEVPVEGTAQNNFKPYKWFKCKSCQALVHEPDLYEHKCDTSMEESPEEEK
jgi:acetyl-CoA carboxylase beta subunit